MTRNTPKVWKLRNYSSAPRVDPHSPSSPGYAERTKAREVELLGFPGTVRIDVGGDTPAAPAAAPAEPPPPRAAEPAADRKDTPPVDLKPGLGKRTR